MLRRLTAVSSKALFADGPGENISLSLANLVPRAFLRRGEELNFPALPLLGGEKPWERGCVVGDMYF